MFTKFLILHQILFASLQLLSCLGEPIGQGKIIFVFTIMTSLYDSQMRLPCYFPVRAVQRSIQAQGTKYSRLPGHSAGTQLCFIPLSLYLYSDRLSSHSSHTDLCFSIPKVFFIISSPVVAFKRTQSDTIVSLFVGYSFCLPMRHIHLLKERIIFYIYLLSSIAPSSWPELLSVLSKFFPVS